MAKILLPIANEAELKALISTSDMCLEHLVDFWTGQDDKNIRITTNYFETIDYYVRDYVSKYGRTDMSAEERQICVTDALVNFKKTAQSFLTLEDGSFFKEKKRSN